MAVAADPAIRREAHEYAAQKMMVDNYVARMLEGESAHDVSQADD